MSHKVIPVSEPLALKLTEKIYGFLSFRSKLTPGRFGASSDRGNLAVFLRYNRKHLAQCSSFSCLSSCYYFHYAQGRVVVASWPGIDCGGSTKNNSTLQGRSVSPLREPSLAFTTEVCLQTTGRPLEDCKRKNRRHNGRRNGTGHQ